MPESEMTSPVAFLVFNRPQTTARVWEAIRKARPPKLLIVADGPRSDRPDDAQRCSDVRAICEHVDWPCDVARNYSDINLGCRRRVSSGLDWVFQTVEEAIVLEDDCLPHPSFFRFCQELLARYRDDERVMLITGDNFQPGPPRTDYSYYFSRYPHIWGWASWRRAWRHYDVDLSLWPIVRDGGWLDDLFERPNVVEYWRIMLSKVANHEIDTWDYQMTFSLRCQNGLSILPRDNLITNIGFGADATHTAVKDSVANLPVRAMEFPLHHPPFMIPDRQADLFTDRRFFSKAPLYARIAHRVKHLMHRMAKPFPRTSRSV